MSTLKVDTIQTTAGAAQELGKVLQVQSVYNTDSGSQYVSDNTATNVTSMSVSITPQCTSSKVLIMVNFCGEWSSSEWDAMWGLRRGSTEIGLPTSLGNTPVGNRGVMTPVAPYQGDNNSTSEAGIFQYLDSPNTTSAVTYYTTFQSYNAGTLYRGRTVGWSGQANHERGGYGMILMEIG